MKKISLPSQSSYHNFKNSKKNLKKFLPIWVVATVIFVAAFIYSFIFGGSSAIQYIFQDGTSLHSNNGRVNILLLGMAGGKYDGATLTDTILVASYNLKTNQLHLISIPRDLWLPPFKSKVNATYQTGLTKGDGLDFAKTVVGNVVGLPIHYGFRVDFNGFIQAVDILKGIEVEVDRTFDDYLYPLAGKENDLCGFKEEEKDFSEEEAKKLNIEPGKRKVFISPEGQIATDSAEENQGIKYFSCRWEHIHFDQGSTLMNGTVALKYVRSRHGTAGEGSDFARSLRQEKVVKAIRAKVLSLETLVNPQRLSELLGTLGKSIDTDISVKDGLEFFRLSKKLTETRSIVLDDSRKENLPNGRKSLLINPPYSDYGGAYVLISQDDDFTIIHDYIKKVFTDDLKTYESSSAARTSAN